MAQELEESELGTQLYWNKVYKSEVKNFRDHGDVGEVWFGEDITDRIVHWMEKNILKTDVIVDVGCGNGMLLIELSRNGFNNLSGIDYSPDAIILAREVSSLCQAVIKFSVGDILKDELSEFRYNVVLDKGTYDAVSLSSNAKINREMYIKNVFNILEDDGIFIITSCNWTRDELIEQFRYFFSEIAVIPTPQFKFGGKIGNIVSSIVFKKLVNV